jgi:phosphatidylserine decarboxylase
MKPSSIGFCLEGLIPVLFLALATLVLAVLGWAPAAVIGLGLTLFTTAFFRDPERVSPDQPGSVVSPADCRVIGVQSAPDPLSAEKKTRISIFMNVFNVHVNRSPVQGRLERISYVPGKFLNASLSKASQDNERNMLVIRDEDDREWTVVQIAGLVARRIVCWAEQGDELHTGQRVGMIKFGSRVDLYCPDGYEILVSKGLKAVGGQTLLARRVMSDEEHP